MSLFPRGRPKASIFFACLSRNNQQQPLALTYNVQISPAYFSRQPRDSSSSAPTLEHACWLPASTKTQPKKKKTNNIHNNIHLLTKQTGADRSWFFDLRKYERARIHFSETTRNSILYVREKAHNCLLSAAGSSHTQVAFNCWRKKKLSVQVERERER